MSAKKKGSKKSSKLDKFNSVVSVLIFLLICFVVLTSLEAALYLVLGLFVFCVILGEVQKYRIRKELTQLEADIKRTTSELIDEMLINELRHKFNIKQ